MKKPESMTEALSQIAALTERNIMLEVALGKVCGTIDDVSNLILGHIAKDTPANNTDQYFHDVLQKGLDDPKRRDAVIGLVDLIRKG